MFVPKAAQHHGRNVKLMGDGELLEFPSVVEAVRFAVDVQCAMRARNEAVPEHRRIRFRMGVNVGDVVVDGDDLYGDSVNIAARLEAMAEPDGICLSRTARDQVRGRLDLDLSDLGELEMKNITRPVRAFAVEMNDKARQLTTPKLTTPIEAPAPGAKRWKVMATGGALTAVALAALLWLQPWNEAAAPWERSDANQARREGPSIAVLPFTNGSDDTSQDYFAAGITEDVTTDLSKVTGLFVAPSSATRRHERASLEASVVGHELGVGHVLAGGVRRAGDRLRITVKLINAAAGVQVWAERYDRDPRDVFAIQDDIAERVVRALSNRLKAESLNHITRAYTTDLEAYDLYIQGRAKRIPPTPENLPTALTCS